MGPMDESDDRSVDGSVVGIRYFLSVLDVAGAAGAVVALGALGVEAGFDSLPDAAEASLDGAAVVPESPLPSLASLDDDGLALAYPSLNQPPPLKEMAAAETTRSSGPPQYGHSVISASENFWIFSVCFLHRLHLYS